MSRAKPADVRFYVDADLLGLAKLLAGVRHDVTYPGDPGGELHKRQRPPCAITDKAAKDSVWIPEVAKRDWLIITRDSRIQQHLAETSAVRDSGARMVALAGKEARTLWQQLEITFSRWRDIERVYEDRGPFIYSATRTTFNLVPL